MNAMPRVSIVPLLSTLLLGIATLPAVAAEGHCTYKLYSKFLDRELKVCQAVTDVAQCGEWPQTEVAYKSWASTASSMTLEKGDCDLEGVVGMCVIANFGTTYFYEGDASNLEAGCRRMKGEWRALRRQDLFR